MRIKHRTAGVGILLSFQAYTLLGAREISPFSTRVDGYLPSTSHTMQLVIEQVPRQAVQISDHGYDEFAAGGILLRDIIVGDESGVEGGAS
jgi:hypothetical protein